MLPETKYARLGGNRIAYQVVGDGPPDLVVTLFSFGHIDIAWEDPGFALFLRTLASFSRVIVFDRRGYCGTTEAGTPSAATTKAAVRAPPTTTQLRPSAPPGRVRGVEPLAFSVRERTGVVGRPVMLADKGS